ncbi:MAG: heavy-metal-associated domain-containing protein [Cytophagaceae bacterium]|nr:heavy-metal-associated domain-containing protein [Cytophagaceae bacterium]
MKTVRMMMAAVALMLATGVVSAQNKKGKAKEEQAVFSVNMHCHDCEQKIKKNIPYEKGVKNLTTNLEKQLVTVSYQPNKTDKAKLKKSIEKLGYTCKEVQNEATK